ncbi:MAG TPA: NAD(P)/FAD-dependent oxidoreductase [Candidatus Polarisedimenticolia bacterium]|nr:NAD(P)/FAD-dependent oxidoreductase [Candidatus Polarisedimenticolia bacterium]
MARQHDAVIVGGGHNGLVVAAYLAARGLDVLVLERRPYVGGASVTEETWPGYKVSTAAYVVSLLRREVVRELDLKKHGLTIYPQDPPYFQPYPDGRYLMIWNDYAKTREEIRKFSARDAGAYEEYERTLNRLAEFVEPLLLMTPPDPTSSRPRDLIGLLRAARLARGLKKDLYSEVEILVGSARDFLDSWFESEELKALLCGQAVIGTFAGPRTPGTAYVLFHHVMGEGDGMRGCWGVVRGGMGRISECIAAAARERGAVIRCGAPVERILVENGRAAGVVLAGGEEVRARAVVSNADPNVTFLKLLDPKSDLPPEFVREVKRFRISGSSVKVNYALSELPDFTALPGKKPGPQHRGTIDICPTLDYMERAYDEAKYGRWSSEPFLEAVIPTTYDDSIAPPGKQIMSVFCQFGPYELKEGTWDTEKEKFGDRVTEIVSRYAPNFKGSVLHRQVVSPLDLERDFGLTHGNIFQGDMTLDQLFFMRPVPGYADYRTPVRGLYLCGACTHPGGGVMGAAGRNAAREILRDRRRGKISR